MLTATPVDYRGGVLLGHTVQWSTSDVGVAVVTASGWVATLGQGPVVLQATCNEASASVRIDVEEAARPAKRVAQVFAQAEGRAANPRLRPPVEMDRPVRRRRTRRSGQRWLFTALAIVLSLPVIWLYGGLGNRIITRSATSSGSRLPAADAFVPASGQPVPAIQRGSSASVKIIRRPRQPLVPGASRQMLAEVRDNTGQALSGSQVRWFSTDSGVARVDSTSGWVRAVGTGRATVIATSGKWRDSAAVVVRRASPRSPDTASISGTAASSLQPGNTVAVSGSAHDGNAAPPAAAESTSNTSDSGSALPGRTCPSHLQVRGMNPSSSLPT